MTVRELIEKLQQVNPDAEVISVSPTDSGDWEWSEDIKVEEREEKLRGIPRKVCFVHGVDY
jgi:hypothetical protein